VFLAQRSLSAAADGAAVAAAEGVDTSRIDDGPDLRCGAALPLDPAAADALARREIAAASPDLARAFVSLPASRTVVSGATVTVELRGTVRVPFGHLLQWLGIATSGGAVSVTESASARSPVSSAAASC
jgi:Flp pilus assembly protein TadG